MVREGIKRAVEERLGTEINGATKGALIAGVGLVCATVVVGLCISVPKIIKAIKE